MLALTDSQLRLVMIAAGGLSPEKRSLFLERVAARLQLTGPRFTGADLDRAVHSALQGLIGIRQPEGGKLMPRHAVDAALRIVEQAQHREPAPK